MSTNPPKQGSTSKQTRSRRSAPENTAAGRAGSAGGVMLEKQVPKKPAPKLTTPTCKPSKPQDAPNEAPKDVPKRKPRKLNKDPSTPATSAPPAQTPEATELEALKSRVRGLEAKVEQLYQSSHPSGPARSPRRRGKGRKGSSATTTATLGSLSHQNDGSESAGVQEAVEAQVQVSGELDRLEDELADARRELALFPSPSSRPQASNADDDDDVEEIPRSYTHARPAVPDRQVTLSGSYRIPLPATLNPEDVRTIQSGVSAATNVARSFMEQRRQNSSAQTQAQTRERTRGGSARETATEGGEKGREVGRGGIEVTDRQTWGDWIGGYSVAISRAVKRIEHEAGVEAVEGQRARAGKRAGV